MNRLRTIKIGRHFLEEIKLCRMCPLHLIYVLALPLEIWSDRLSCQLNRPTYMYMLINHWMATKTTGSCRLENLQTCRKSHHFYIICSRCLPPARTQAHRRWHHVVNLTFNEQRDSDCSLVFDVSSQFVDIWDLSIRWKRTFRACNVKMM